MSRVSWSPLTYRPLRKSLKPTDAPFPEKVEHGARREAWECGFEGTPVFLRGLVADRETLGVLPQLRFTPELAAQQVPGLKEGDQPHTAQPHTASVTAQSVWLQSAREWQKNAFGPRGGSSTSGGRRPASASSAVPWSQTTTRNTASSTAASTASRSSTPTRTTTAI